jgi:hypothetical protein
MKLSRIFEPKRALAVLLIAAMAVIGCGADQILQGLNAAAAVANVAAPIIATISPEYGGLVATVGKALTDLSGLYAQYEAASATEKPGIAGQIHALTATALANLQIIFVDGRIKNPQLQMEITAFVSVANSAIQVLLNKLPPPTTPSAQAAIQSIALPTIPNAKSADDLKKYWNGQVGASHPTALVK